MRPADEVTRVLLFAVCALHGAGRSATLSELAGATGVAVHMVRSRVRDLRRHGHLTIVRQRRVAWRNRPVAEYAPATRAQAPECALSGVAHAWAAT